MTQIVVTLDSSADSTLLRQMIENMKGVIKTSVKNDSKSNSHSSDQWIEKLRHIKNSMDPTLIDLRDEKTRYIMNK